MLQGLGDTVLINIESNFNLRDTSWSRSNSVKSECTEELVILSKFTFTLKNIDVNSFLIISIC